MNNNVRKLTEAAPLREVQDHITRGGAELHYRFRAAPQQNAPLIIRFHGAIQRESRPLPAFQPNLRQVQHIAHQITICDPTMMSREGFSCSWYAGHEKLPAQAILGDFLGELITALDPSRTVYLGSSSGGFAALYHSYHHPGSVALVMVPQTNLPAHFSQVALNRYRDNCWPRQTWQTISESACIDVAPLYREGFPNTVVYVQSQGDFRHNSLQLQPFMGACWNSENPNRDQFILSLDYWGKPGHGGAVPPEGYLPWLTAILSSVTTDASDILKTKWDATSSLSHGPSDHSAAPANKPNTADMNIAQRITQGILEREAN